jgi:hypothetical protein
MEDEQKKPLQILSDALSLNYESQDWGIINADPTRIEEFISYYTCNKELNSFEKFGLGELIIASVNDAMCEGLMTDIIKKKFESFILENGVDFDLHLKYWYRLSYRSDEFPVAMIVKKIIDEDK